MGIINYQLPDELHRQAKMAAAARGVTLRAFIVQLLELGVRATDLDGDRSLDSDGAHADRARG